MALDYDTYVSQLANLMVIPSSDSNFTTFLPGCIDYAEQRCYRDLQLQDTVVRDVGTISANNRTFTLPNNFGAFVVVQGMNLYDSGQRLALVPTSQPLIDVLWPNDAAPSAGAVPRVFAMITDTTALVGPAPDQQYSVEVVGTIRPTPLSSSNTTTILTQDLPDLFMAASMIFATGYQRDFGSQADDPKMSQSWEMQYGALLQSANGEEIKKKFGLTGGPV